MLGDEEVRKLLAAAQSGDAGAREALLQENLNLVRSIVHRFTGRGCEWDDLFQIGCIGLMKAIERFDPAFSVRFSTYAVPMIIGEIRRFLRDDSPVKVSRPLKELAYRIHRARERLQGTLGRDPTMGELAADLARRIWTGMRRATDLQRAIASRIDALRALASHGERAHQSDASEPNRPDATPPPAPPGALVRTRTLFYLRDVQDHLDGLLRTRLGVTAPVTHRWAACVAYSRDGLPVWGEWRAGLYVTGAYSGTGNVFGALCGRALADLALGRRPALAAWLQR